MPRIELRIETPFTGCDDVDVVDCPDNWGDMTEAEREDWAQGELDTAVQNFISTSWRVLDN